MFRPAKSKNDIKLIYEIRSSKQALTQSINSQQFTFNEHKEWFNKYVVEEKTYSYFIFSKDDNNNIGFIRVHNISNFLSWAIDPKQMGKKYGYLMLNAFISFKPSKYKAHIKKDNIPSLKIAKKCGFKQIQERKNNVIEFSL